jgi:hypothetical protein
MIEMVERASGQTTAGSNVAQPDRCSRKVRRGKHLYCRAPISDARLAEIEADWEAIRAAGMKVVPRFLYDWSMHNREPPTENIAGHLEQLAQLLSRNADVIAWLEAGLFGGSGEAAASGQGHVIEATERDRLQQLSDGAMWLYNRMSEAVPGRCLALRYPR